MKLLLVIMLSACAHLPPTTPPQKNKCEAVCDANPRAMGFKTQSAYDEDENECFCSVEDPTKRGMKTFRVHMK
jgi:hypothetical protein